MEMLCGTLLKSGVKFDQSGFGSPHCKLCDSKLESISHITATCLIFDSIRSRILAQFDDLLKLSKNELRIYDFLQTEHSLTQFILDPTSMDLTKMVHINDPILQKVFSFSRDMCFAICKRRTSLLKQKK